MAALTTGQLTITASGSTRQIGAKVGVFRLRFACTGQTYPTSGIPMPTTPASWGFKSRLDYVELLDRGIGRQKKFEADIDYPIMRIKLYNASVTGVTVTKKKNLQATTTEVVATGTLDFYVRAKGF